MSTTPQPGRLHPLNYQKGGTWRLVPEEPPPNTSSIPRMAGSAPELTGCTREVIHRSTSSAEVNSCLLFPSVAWLHPLPPFAFWTMRFYFCLCHPYTTQGRDKYEMKRGWLFWLLFFFLLKINSLRQPWKSFYQVQ